MLAVLQFIFSSFWTWAGTVVLVFAMAGVFRPLMFTVNKERKPQ